MYGKNLSNSELKSLTEKLINVLSTREEQTRSILSRRSSMPQVCFIEKEYRFIKKIKPMNEYLMCKLFIFNRKVSDLVFLEFYHNRLKKNFQVSL